VSQCLHIYKYSQLKTLAVNKYKRCSPDKKYRHRRPGTQGVVCPGVSSSFIKHKRKRTSIQFLLVPVAPLSSIQSYYIIMFIRLYLGCGLSTIIKVIFNLIWPTMHKYSFLEMCSTEMGYTQFQSTKHSGDWTKLQKILMLQHAVCNMTNSVQAMYEMF